MGCRVRDGGGWNGVCVGGQRWVRGCVMVWDGTVFLWECVIVGG